MADDLVRMEAVPHSYYNFHPGSHVKQGAECGIELIAGLLNEVLAPEQTTTVLLETMAGKVLKWVARSRSLRRLSSALNLLTMWACASIRAMYGMAVTISWATSMACWRNSIAWWGLPRLRAVHINDSKNPCGAHKDRHEKIGQGFIGVEAFERIVNHPALRELPFILETPNELPGYAEEIALLRSLAE